MTESPDLNALSAAANMGQPQAQYQLGALYFSRGEVHAALDWLSRASESGIADAQNLLGVIYVNGIGIPCQPQKALELFRLAADLGLKEAHFNLAGLLFYGSATKNDDSEACRHLLRAAELHHRPALRVLGYLYTVTGDAVLQALATRCLAGAAALGDAHSEYALGMLYLEGAGICANFDEGVYWLTSAARKNLYCAGLRIKSLQRETGDARIRHIASTYAPIAKQLAAQVPDLQPLYFNFETPVFSKKIPRRVSEYPQTLAELLCDYLVNLAAPRLVPSGVVDPATGKPIKTRLRTSSSMNFQLSMYDMVVSFICRRLASLVDMQVPQAEPISVLRYLPGEEYKPHYDHFAVDEQGAPKVQDTNGQRIITVFAYLNGVDEGGETDFPRLNIRVKPGKGKAVAFRNCTADGKADPDTLHAGLPVVSGEKWLATLWFRERPFNWI